MGRVTPIQVRIENAARIFEEQWSRGDLKAACDVYADNALYISATHGVVVGKPKILERYEKDFPDRTVMGTLHLQLEKIGCDLDQSSAWALWHWTIDREGSKSEGYALENYKVVDGKLVIVSDMTLTMSKP